MKKECILLDGDLKEYGAFSGFCWGRLPISGEDVAGE